MASLLSLSAELNLSIIEQLDLTSTSFIPAPSQDLLSISRVCKVLRTLSLPYLLKSVTLLNEKRSGSSVLAVLDSAYAEHVRSVHYIGVIAIPEDQDFGENFPRAPSQEDLPEQVEQVLSSLAKLPNLERVTVQFACAKTADEDDDIYPENFDLEGQLDNDEQVLESEKTIAFRSLMERSYRALSRNPAASIIHLELKNVVAKKCSAWNLVEFHAVLRNLSTFTISLRGGDNGAGWHINMLQEYLDFVSELHVYFFEHLCNVKHLNITATTDGPPGIKNGLNNTTLPLLEQHMLLLRNLSLEHVFISRGLAAFIKAHSNTLESIRLKHCYSGLEDVEADEDTISWGDFFSSIASTNTTSLKVFDIGASDLEQLQLKYESNYRYNEAVRTQKLHDRFPERRMFDYKTLDDKYGMVFDNIEQACQQFETGSDHTSWEQLCKIIEKNVWGGAE